MAIKNIIAKGIGFAPGSTAFIPTHGFSIGAVVGAAVATALGIAHRLSIFNRSGALLAELDVQHSEAWQLRESSELHFVIAKTEAKATAANLAPRNLVLVESADLENWVGFIWYPIEWTDSAIEITALSAERLFEFRFTNTTDDLSGTAGAIAQALVNIANQSEATGVTVASDDVSATGDVLSREYHVDNIFDALNRLAADANAYWWVEGERSGGSLALSFHWASARGGTFGTLLEEGHNLIGLRYTEEGGVATEVIGIGRFADWAAPLTSTQADSAAQATYGLIQMAYTSQESTDQASLTAVVAAQLAQHNHHRRLISATIGQSPYPRLGDTVTVRLIKFGFISGALGGSLTMVVHGLAYDAKTDTVEVVLRETG